LKGKFFFPPSKKWNYKMKTINVNSTLRISKLIWKFLRERILGILETSRGSFLLLSLGLIFFMFELIAAFCRDCITINNSQLSRSGKNERTPPLIIYAIPDRLSSTSLSTYLILSFVLLLARWDGLQCTYEFSWLLKEKNTVIHWC
jgi:hypothetical protein